MYFKNNRTALIFLLAMLVVAPIKAQVAFGDAAKFNDGWLFRLTDDSAIVRTDYDDSEWRKLSLPHDWSIEGQLSPTLASCTGYLPGGIGWYRKHFRVEDNATRHYIYFEGVYNRSEVYLNGHLLGRRPNGYVSFLYDMTPYLKEGDNVLAVRVDHSRYADSRWYTGSGIYRDVWLVAAPDTHIAQWGVGWHAASLTDKQAVVAVDVEVEKHKATSDKLELKASLYDTAGKKVAQRRVRVADGKEGIAKQSLDLKVSKPHRWNLDNPYLYTLKTELLANGKRIDVVLPTGTTTTLTDGANGTHDACLFVNGHAELKGGGTLNLTGNTKHAYASDEYTILKPSFGTLNVTSAVGDGMHVNQYLLVEAGTVNIAGTKGDCIDVGITKDPLDELNGQAQINGGTLHLDVTSDDTKGLKTDSMLTISGGRIEANVAGNGAKGISTGTHFLLQKTATTSPDISMTVSGGIYKPGDALLESKCRGIKVKGDFTFDGGNINMTVTGQKAKGISVDGLYTYKQGTSNVQPS